MKKRAKAGITSALILGILVASTIAIVRHRGRTAQNEKGVFALITHAGGSDRRGTNLAERTLKPSNVGSAQFGLQYQRAVDGPLLTQPLYAPAVNVAGSGTKNVVFVATGMGTVYAFDADDETPAPGDPACGADGHSSRSLWCHKFPNPDPQPLCDNTNWPSAILATPVIDTDTQTMFVLWRDTTPVYHLSALDIATGSLRAAHSEVAVDTKLKFHGFAFHPEHHASRPGLLLLDGVVYVAFASRTCDQRPYQGWLMGFRADTLALAHIFCTAPPPVSGAAVNGAGIWQSGAGIAGDAASHSVFVTTGNSEDAPNLNYADRFLRFDVGPNSPVELARPVASEWDSHEDERHCGDVDLGSGGPVLVPGGPAGTVVGGGKEGRLYVLDRDTLNERQSFQAAINTWHDDPGKAACPPNRPPRLCDEPGAGQGFNGCDCDSGNCCYLDHSRYVQLQWNAPNIHGSPVYWEAADGTGWLFVSGEKDYIRAFRYNPASGVMDTTPAHKSDLRGGDSMPNGALSLSANGTQDPILWVSMVKEGEACRQHGDCHAGDCAGTLVALSVPDLKTLWRDDRQVIMAKFVPPTIGGGRVFRPTRDGKLLVYGLRRHGHQEVTAVWRPWGTAHHLDVFATGMDGNTYTSNWEGSWNPLRPWQAIGNRDGSLPGQLVTAVWRPWGNPHMDVFATGMDGNTYTTHWEGSWSGHWEAIGDRGGAIPGQPVTAVWRPWGTAHHIDVFATGVDGNTYTTYWEGSWSQQRPWEAIGNRDGSLPGQLVTAVWRPWGNPHMDVFATGMDGNTYTTHWEGSWSGHWEAIGDRGGAIPGQPVTAVWRPWGTAHHIDVFATGVDGNTYTTYWEGSWSQRRPWEAIGERGGSLPGQLVTAAWRPSGSPHMDVFATGMDGNTYTTHWEGSWARPWEAIGDHGGSAPGAPVTAVWRPWGSLHMDVFATGMDGNTYTTHWEGSWARPWTPIGDSGGSAP